MAKQQQQPKKDIIKRLRGITPRERLLHRLHAVVLVESGVSAVQAGVMYGDSARAVAYWVKRFKEQGVAGLNEETRPGRPSTLSDARVKQVQAFMRQHKARGKKVSAKELSLHLAKKYQIVLTPRQCWRIIKKIES